MVTEMFRKAWDMRHAHLDAAHALAKRELASLDQQIEQLVDRMAETNSATAFAAFERRLEKLERDRLTASERLTDNAGPKRPFDEMFELALAFLSNP